MDDASTPPAAASMPPPPSASVPTVLMIDTRAAPEDAASPAAAAAPEPTRKGSSEWASPRSRGRRGTPPPVPRRASRGEDELSGNTGGVLAAAASAVGAAELPPRPRTPAQVLASRAAAAKASTMTTTPAAAATPPLSPAADEETTASLTAGSQDKDHAAAKTEPDDSADVSRGPERGDGGGSAYTKEDVADLVGTNEDGASAEGDTHERRRTSVQLSAAGSEPYDASDAEDGESFRRDDRVDTSTVDEESMYNDEDDDGDDENDEEGEYEDGDDDHESPGTSDSYVNIHGEHDGEEDEEDEDEIRGQQRRRGQMMGDDSLTPDSTPPPSPPRTVQHQQRRPAPPPIASEWVKYVAESGHEYYFNTHTHVSQWTRPVAMVLSPRSGVIERETGGNDEEDGPEEENQIQHGEVSTAEMPPYLQMQLPQGYLQQQHQPAAVRLQHQPPLSSAYLENLFAAAAKNDETAQLQALLRYEVDVNAVNASGLTPLHVAVQHGNARGAAMLLDYGALVDGPSEETGMIIGGIYASARLIETPLVTACRTNHASLVRLLVRYGASIYTRDNDSNTVLHIAIRCWSDEVLGCLLEMDSIAAIINLRNADDETPLHLAARHGNANAVRALLSSGASTDVEDAQGRTPLVVSVMENRVECAQLLQGVGHSDVYGSGTINDSTGEPAMYDSNPKEEEAAARQGSDELEGLRVYLMQLVQHATTDGVLVSTIYQYMDAVQREIAAMNSAQAESRQREENLLSQIDELTNHESITSSELAKEREENDRLRHQLEAKEVEMNSVQAAFDSLSSRSTMLESIARSSQDKLRRERSEFARQEEYWNQTIENSLRENAALLESVQSLQQGWQGHPVSGEAKTVMTTNEDEVTLSNEVYEDSYGAIQKPVAYTEFAAQSDYDAYQNYYANTGDDQSYDVSQPSHIDNQYRYPDQASADKKQSASTPSAKSEPERPISPERVDAVWNRFFENMSRAAEVDNAPTHPPSRNATLSPRQAAAPVSMLPPASDVFASIRKSSKDRLHQLLLSGISPNVRDLGEKGTPLHLASELGDLESVMLLCEFGADVEIRDENGSTPLLVACSQGHYECTKFLLQSAANQAATNASRDSALHLAAWDGSFECVEILLEYGVDVLARNGLGLTALANLKTRSPLRHRFDDLSSDHPMAKTLMILEEAERFEKAEEVQPTHDVDPKRPKELMTASSQSAKHDPDAKSQASSTSWSRWILGSVFGSYKNSVPVEGAAVSDEDEDDDDNKSDFEEAESSPSKLHAARLHEYEDLRPPPEIEAELRRKPLSPSSSDPLPPPPPEVLDALERRKLVGGGLALLSPTSSATRFASPASMPSAKKSASSTPTSVRSRYVDTFNSP